jgi:YD repeat-containing protein
LSKSGLVSGNTYIISYWSGNGVYSINGGTSTYTTGKKIGVWVYYEHKVTATSTTLTITGNGVIDEVRLYPATAQMTTFTYAPIVGVTSACDADNRITYYFYDGLGRLKYVEDQDGNIIKTYQYHYENQTTN